MVQEVINRSKGININQNTGKEGLVVLFLECHFPPLSNHLPSPSIREDVL